MKKVFIIGDSISMHYNEDIKTFLGGYATCTRKGEGQDAGDLNHASAVNGGDSACVLEYLKYRRDIDADIFLINCGLHDIKYYEEVGHLQVEPEAYRNNLKEIVKDIKARGKEMIWVMSTTVDDEIHQSHCSVFSRKSKDIIAYNSIAKEVMQEERIPVVDLYDFTEKLGEGVFCDHVHFHPEVRKLHAAYLAGQIIALCGLEKT